MRYKVAVFWEPETALSGFAADWEAMMASTGLDAVTVSAWSAVNSQGAHRAGRTFSVATMGVARRMMGRLRKAGRVIEVWECAMSRVVPAESGR